MDRTVKLLPARAYLASLLAAIFLPVAVVGVYVFAQQAAGPQGISGVNTQTPAPTIPGTMPGQLNFPQPVIFQQEAQAALDPSNPRDLVPLEYLSGKLGASTNLATGACPTGGACGTVVIPPSTVSSATGISTVTQAGSSVLLYKIVPAGFQFTSNQPIATLQNSRSWSVSTSDALLQATGSVISATVNSVASTANDNGVTTITLTTGPAIPTGHRALLAVLGVCSGGGSFPTANGFSILVQNDVNFGSGCWDFFSTYQQAGPIAAGTVWTFSGISGAQGAGKWSNVTLALLDVVGWNSGASTAQCSGSCTQSATGTSTAPQVGTASGSVTAGPVLALIGLNTHAALPSETVVGINGWTSLFAYNAAGTVGPAQIQWQYSSTNDGAFKGPAWISAGTCTLASGACTSTFFKAYPTAVSSCVANGLSTANPMKVGVGLSSVTVTSSSGADTQSVAYFCIGY